MSWKRPLRCFRLLLFFLAACARGALGVYSLRGSEGISTFLWAARQEEMQEKGRGKHCLAGRSGSRSFSFDPNQLALRFTDPSRFRLRL